MARHPRRHQNRQRMARTPHGPNRTQPPGAVGGN
nr:MAG TPA: hypothetical protein [Caudoviricetes sp.]